MSCRTTETNSTQPPRIYNREIAIFPRKTPILARFSLGEADFRPIFPSETASGSPRKPLPPGPVRWLGAGPGIFRSAPGSRPFLPLDRLNTWDPDMRLRHPFSRSTVAALLLGAAGIAGRGGRPVAPAPPAKCAPDNGGLTLAGGILRLGVHQRHRPGAPHRRRAQRRPLRRDQRRLPPRGRHRSARSRRRRRRRRARRASARAG